MLTNKAKDILLGIIMASVFSIIEIVFTAWLLKRNREKEFKTKTV